MTDTAVQTPLAIDRVERTRGKKDQVRLRVSGRWLAPGDPEAGDALLVVQLHGRRHRFPANRGGDDEGQAEAGRPFTASFNVPDWAVPDQPGQAVLWVGDAVVPVPPPGAPAPAPGSSPGPARARSYPHPALAGSEPQVPAPGLSAPATGGEDTVGPDAPVAGRSGPLSQLLFKETVDALHAELEQRSGETARLRSALAELRTDMEGRTSAQSELEVAHAELREELGRLITAVSGQQEEFEGRLAALTAERDGARDESARAGEELSGVREELAAVSGELAAARDDLQRVRQEADDRLAGERSGFDQRLAAARAESEEALAAARDQASADLAGVRAQAEAEAASARERAEADLETARAESEAMLGAARSHSDSRASAAEAQARELADRVGMLQAHERRDSEQLASLREQLAAAHISRDAALGEADGLRIELDRVGSELGALREQTGPPGGGLSDVRQLLADARALTERLRGEADD